MFQAKQGAQMSGSTWLPQNRRRSAIQSQSKHDQMCMQVVQESILPIALKFSKPSDPRDSVGQ